MDGINSKRGNTTVLSSASDHSQTYIISAFPDGKLGVLNTSGVRKYCSFLKINIYNVEHYSMKVLQNWLLYA